MPTTNYFAVSQEVRGPRGKRRIADHFFFDGSNPDSIRKAFDGATSAFLDTEDTGTGQVAVFKAPRISGPWDGINVIGEAFRDLPPEE